MMYSCVKRYLNDIVVHKKNDLIDYWYVVHSTIKYLIVILLPVMPVVMPCCDVLKSTKKHFDVTITIRIDAFLIEYNF